MKRSLIILTTILLFLGCRNDKLFEISIEGKDKFFGLTLSNKNLKTPLKIIGDSLNKTGAFFFETSKGKTWLKGEPIKMVNSKDLFEAEWNLDGRNIIINFKGTSGKIEFSFKANPDTDILKWGISLSATNKEYFTGLFERTVDGNQKESWKKGIQQTLNIRGLEVDMLINYTLSLYDPFYISSNGYGLFINGTWPGHYDMCKADPTRVKVEFEGPSLSGIIYTAPTPVDIVKSHSLYVGPTFVPPKWAFLPWRWRDNHTNSGTYYDKTKVNAPYNSQLVEDILMMKALDIPNGVYWVDRPWGTGKFGYDDFEWDPARFPNATKMIQWIHSNDMKFLLWIAPWVSGNMRLEAIKKGYNIPILKPEGGADSTNVASLDLTNPDACKWWQENALEKVLKEGVDGFKMDRGEELLPNRRDMKVHDGRSTREIRNDYPVLYVKTAYESCKKIHGDDFMLLPRAGYTGSSKYSGFWGGDIGSPPEGLRAAIIAVQRSAIIGFPVWGSDIGGYWDGNLDREVCARWLAFGCFNPIMEFGPTRDKAPWDMESVPNYDTELIATWRVYAKVHTALANYTYSLAKEAHETGMPIVRPLFLEYPDQEKAWTNWQTFKYGPDILVSALWQKEITSYKCYLPRGTKWRDAWNTKKIYEGGQEVNINTPLHKIPIFIRDGSSVNLGDLDKLYQQSLDLAKLKPDLNKLQKEIK
jgi:alpha-D-xyloside xylohydrolase